MTDSGHQLRTQHVEGCFICPWASSNDDVDRHGDQGQDILANDLAKPAFEPVALHDRMPVLGDNDTDPGMTQKGSEEPNLEVLGSSSLPFT